LSSLTSKSSETTLYHSSVAPVEDVRRSRGWAFPNRSVDVAGIALALALSTSIAAWFSTIRSPLWLDETFSYSQIAGGFRQIWARQMLSFPAYSYILWLTKTLFGPSEVVLRMPSVLAMIAATFVLYRAAREFFSSDVAVIVAVVFCLHPTVAFAAVDARPYAFAVLVVNCAILSFARWMKTNSHRDGIFFGVSAAGIFYFHYLFGVILPAFAILLVVMKGREWRSWAPKVAAAAVPFALMLPPVIPTLLYLFRTGPMHVFDHAPEASDFLFTLAPGDVLTVFVGVCFLAATLRKLESPSGESLQVGLTGLLLAVVPLTILFEVSTHSSVHVFVDRYRLVAIPGVALCWGFLVSQLRSRTIRAIFCAVLVVVTFSGLSVDTFSIDHPHGYTWKYALEKANKSAAPDNAPLLICSDMPDSNFGPMPADAANDILFAPLSYYKAYSPVVPLPRALNKEAMEQVNNFLATAAPARQRFLALGFFPSNPTLDWITKRTKDTYVANNLGIYDGVTVMEYSPQ